MEFEKIHNKGRVQLFQNQYLELLTKSHPLVIWGLYLPIIIGLLFYSSKIHYTTRTITLIFLGGVFFWTFFEYIMHRFIFHMASESKRAKKFMYLLHGNHHHYPRDRDRLFMPPVPSILISSIIFLAMYGLMETNTFMFFPGFMFGYLLYGSMHYAIHAWTPPFKWMKPLWRNHHLHHYKNDQHGYGVSSTLWDHIFGTMFDLKNEKEDKEKEKELMF